jgi:hypothetical protein
MFAPHRITGLLTIALAACAVTWAVGGVAVAKPVVMRQPPSMNHRPEFKAVVGDRHEPAHPGRPAFTVVQGDSHESAHAGRPAFTVVQGDVKSDADRARAVVPAASVAAAHAAAPAAPAADDNTGTAALIVSIAAILTALGAVTFTATRMPRGAARA